ncbi:carbonic anhydrase [Methylotenera sp. L2L1]|uniref:carbonic anhydrase n=1 Tax=Methylotenera sp. L2L1 TaxID=1502770 RepID=UPI00068DF833|nr:carbonic anhydrase family protein [Methylotenera sp. L2L1]
MQKALSYFTLSLVCFFISIGTCSAANWAKLNENSTSKLMIDKQSILEKDKLKRAWVKIEYKTIQKNLESPDTQYNLSKLLWYFDCPSQKSAATQVFQYLNTELVHSAAIDNVKDAQFIEPVPESDFDRVMQYVCASHKSADTKAATPTPSKAPTSAETKTEANASAKPADAESKPVDSKPAEAKPSETKPADKSPAKPSNKKVEESKKPAAWSYDGKEGPSHWGKLSSEYSMCDAGKSQSPIDIEESLDANLKPLKLLQKFPVKEVLKTNHSIQLNFKDGNIVAIDNMTFKLKQINFHTPSEHSIKGKSFPLEAQFLHTDTKGSTAIVAVLFREGKPNPALEKILKQLPTESEKPATLKSRVLASEMMPSNQDYYRFSGSLTTPPCTEGIRWILIKTPITASKAQIEALAEVVTSQNNRPIQALNGRLIVD